MSDPSDDASFPSRFCRLLLLLALSATLPGCGVAYTIVKSESKLDKLSVPMAQDLDEIRGAGRVLRGPGPIVVREVFLHRRPEGRVQFGPCSPSTWTGRPIVYPFSHLGNDPQPGFPHHCARDKDDLCAWG